MPKIKAKTVLEHRQNQKIAVLNSAKQLFEVKGVDSVSMGEIADKAKLARPSVYEYFKSKSDIIVAIIEEQFPPWILAVKAEMNKQDTGSEKIEAFFRSQTKMFEDGKHELAFLLMHSKLDQATQKKVNSFHMDVISLLREPLRSLGYKDSEEALALMAGVLQSILHLAQQNSGSSSKLSRTASAFALGGLKAALHKPR